MATKFHVRKGDTVKVLSGVDAGKTGKVLEVIPKSGRLLVEGINIQKRHTKPTRVNPQGGIVERPGPLNASKVMLVCPSCHEPGRVARRVESEGVSTRVCRHCGKPID